MKLSLILLVISVATNSLFIESVFSQQPSLRWLGVISDYQWSEAYDVSDDGTLVTGVLIKSSGSFVHPFRWEESSGMQDIESDSNMLNYAYGISGDGSTIVGMYNTGVAWKPYYFTNSIGKVPLPTLDNGRSGRAYSVNSSGSKIVGQSDSSYFNVSIHAVLWENNTIIDLGRKWPYGSSCATGISGDGSTIVGFTMDNPYSNTIAFCNNTSLGTLGGLASYARNVSYDGSTVVGWSTDSLDRMRAFRWSLSGGMSSIHTLGFSYSSDAYDVSADGSVIVGQAIDPGGSTFAFRWTAERGIQNLNIEFSDLLTPGSKLIIARAITPNGRIIVGYGVNSSTGRREAFLLDTGEPTGISDENYTISEFQLYQNYPNPFNPSTTIRYTIPASTLNTFSKGEETFVQLKVYDVLGNEIATLVDDYKSSGNYEVEWNAYNCASGVYFYQLKVADPEIKSGQGFIQTKKMIYLR